MEEDSAATPEELLARAHELHGQRKTDEAIRLARRALTIAPGFTPALSYLGTTLITRKLAFQEGLNLLERAAEVAPDDAGVLYSLGWCYEFVAYRLEKDFRKPYRDPLALYAAAAEALRRVIALQPEEKLVEDAEDLLASIEEKL